MKRLLPLLLVLALCLPAAAQRYVDPAGWKFSVTNGVATVTGHQTPAGSYTGPLDIPGTVSGGGNTYIVVGVEGFKYYTQATSLSLPASLTAIGASAFYGCSGLTGSLSLPDGVTTIGTHAFKWCSGLSGTLQLPSALKTIGEGAFDGCDKFTGSLSLPDGVTTIGLHAFAYCSGFTGDVTLPKSVSYLGGYSFLFCNRLTGFTIEAGTALTSLSSAIWRYCSALEYIDLQSLPASALQGCSFSRTQVALAHPFYELPSHTVVYLPTGVAPSRITQSDVNYVLDGQCQWFSVQDDYDYELPYGFTARKATYNKATVSDYRTFAGTTAKTLYLPYPATLPQGMKAYALAKRHAHTNDVYEEYFVFSSLPEGSSLAANTPYLLVVTDGQTKQFGIDTDVVVPQTPGVDASTQIDFKSQWLFCGTTEQISNAAAYAQGAYNLKNNVWHPILPSNTNGYVNHFRCFIKPAPGNTQPAKRFAIFLSEEGDTETGIEEARQSLNQGVARIYDTSGRYCGTDLDRLPEGLYVVNGKRMYKF